MKRTKHEINYAASLILAQGGENSVAQAEVLRKGYTESKVFELYVKNIPEAERNESLFFAVRDAARYAAGLIELEELIPGAELPVIEEEETNEGEGDNILINRNTLRALLIRVARLEKALNISDSKPAPIVDANDDLISQAEASRYVDCHKTTIKLWGEKGWITTYRKGNRLYYSKRELSKSKVVKSYKNSRYGQR